MAVRKEVLTLEEFLALPEEPALEFAEGRVTQKPLPKARHSILQKALVKVFDRLGERRKTAWAFPELRTTFTGRSYVPDVAVYRWDRIPVDDRGRVTDELHDPPDIPVEVVSGQSVNALNRKCLWSVANGVGAALLVDPDDESVVLFRPGQLPVALHGRDILKLDDLVPGFRLPVEKLFAALQIR